MPLAALVASEAVSCFEPGDQGGTFNGNPLMAAVGCAVMEIVNQPTFLATVRETSDYLAARLGALSAALGHGAVRGRGLLRRSRSVRARRRRSWTARSTAVC